jgi:hypothetical protein
MGEYADMELETQELERLSDFDPDFLERIAKTKAERKRKKSLYFKFWQWLKKIYGNIIE